MNASTQRVLMSGNEALAQGALDAGCTFYAGYPITPQNELIGYMAQHMPGEGVFIQAESELGAINMVYGAAAAGVRAMTSSSSPGMSLKQEGISYLAGAELPAVIVNIMRGGPGLGNIAPAQSDYFQATRGGGHGDYHCIVLAPASVQESYDLMGTAFDLADEYRVPVIMLGDGILGQMMEPVMVAGRGSPVTGRRSQVIGHEISAPDWKTRDRRLVTKPWALTGCAGRKPNVVRSFFLNEGMLEEFNKKLQRKYAVICRREQELEEFLIEDARIILVAYGTMARICKSVVKRLRSSGIKAGLIRPVTLWPFPVRGIERRIRKAGLGSFLVVEMSYGQMVEDVRLAVNGAVPVHFLGRAGGGVPSEESIEKKVKAMYKC